MNKIRTKETEKKYIEQIDTLKGIAIFMVILGHSIIKYPINLHDNVVCNYVYRLVSSVHMPLFFVISGYCYTQKANFKDYLFAKIKRLMIPYFIFGILDIIPRYLLSFMVNRPRGIVESVISILLFGGEYWFLYVLFIIFVIYPFINSVLEKNKYLSMMMIPLLIILSKYMSSVDIFQINKTIYYLSFFMTGWIVRKKAGKDIFKIDSNSNELVVLVALLWTCLVLINEPYLAELSCVFGLLLMYMIANYKNINIIFSRFGKYSLQLYLFNGYFLVLSRTVIVKVFGITNPLIIVAGNVLFMFLISYLLIAHIFSKFKIFRIIMGIV